MIAKEKNVDLSGLIADYRDRYTNEKVKFLIGEKHFDEDGLIFGEIQSGIAKGFEECAHVDELSNYRRPKSST